MAEAPQIGEEIATQIGTLMIAVRAGSRDFGSLRGGRRREHLSFTALHGAADARDAACFALSARS